jgi:hypothetical protein
MPRVAGYLTVCARLRLRVTYSRSVKTERFSPYWRTMGALVAPAMAHTAHGTLLGRRGDLTAAAEEIERGSSAAGQRIWHLLPGG